MVIHRRKKVGKYRGHTTHGHGHRKKRRGAGSRGGRGKAGSGKKSGHKKNLFGPLGQKGFTSIWRKEDHVVNIGYFTPSTLQKFLQEGKATKDKDKSKEKEVVVIDLTKLGYDKLLGSGSLSSSLSMKVKFIVPAWSASAEKKVKAAGGELVKA